MRPGPTSTPAATALCSAPAVRRRSVDASCLNTTSSVPSSLPFWGTTTTIWTRRTRDTKTPSASVDRCGLTLFIQSRNPLSGNPANVSESSSPKFLNTPNTSCLFCIFLHTFQTYRPELPLHPTDIPERN